MNQLSFAALNEALVGKLPPGTLTYAWLRRHTATQEVILLVSVDDDFPRYASPLRHLFYIRTFHEGRVSAVLLTLELNQATHRLWLDYWCPGGETAECLSCLARQGHIAAALCTSRGVIAIITLANPYQSLLANFVIQIKQRPAWTTADFTRARDALGQNESRHLEPSEPACST